MHHFEFTFSINSKPEQFNILKRTVSYPLFIIFLLCAKKNRGRSSRCKVNLLQQILKNLVAPQELAVLMGFGLSDGRGVLFLLLVHTNDLHSQGGKSLISLLSV